ncbi:hypothetical protein [Deinococcus ruber]|uniref:Uncharacterized protein n=1 Tax=Deinococcus ruber TaxID=1848197 RepID=A0A918FIK2_9DEIO|nr:hypothetical protein [Deinococcus ruber]GGR39827.1 hypothetical protein GCM10008957_55720 [Deinococcus ruber]
MNSNLTLFPDDYESDAFRREVEHYGFFAIASVIDTVYAEAAAEGRRYSQRPEQRRMTGHIRHSLIEQELRSLPILVPGVDVADQPYRTGTGSFLRMQIGRMMLSQSCVADEDTIPRTAQFRTMLRRLNQWTLDEVALGNGPLRHALIIHGPEKDDVSIPAFIMAAMPSPCGTRYLYKYDLRQHPGANLVIPATPVAPTMPSTGIVLPVERKVSVKKRAKQENQE